MVRVRFAPSPTGKLHLGSARTAVFNWLYSRHKEGKFVLRIEDTDLNRSEEAYTESIIKDLKWMGMDYDEFYRQSSRFEIYSSYAEKLLKNGKAYYCTCDREEIHARNTKKGINENEAHYDGFCRGNSERPSGSFVIRIYLGENRDISFNDSVKKMVKVNTKELDDFVIMKSDGTPTYNFAVVVDDALMNITHVIRGEDHITNTVKQIVLYEFLGLLVPQFAHLPLVMGKDKTPLSKRKGSTNIEYYRSIGILPEALLNAIARLGWSHGNDEYLDIPDLIRFFDIDKLNKSSAVYDEEKMTWVNGKHMKAISMEKLETHFKEFLAEAGLNKTGKMEKRDWLLMAMDLLRGRHSTLKSLYDEISLYASNSFSYEEDTEKTMNELLKNTGIGKAFQESRQIVLSINDFSNLDGIEEKLRKTAEENQIKFGELVQALRIKLTGKKNTPDILTVLKLLGEEAKKRITGK